MPAHQQRGDAAAVGARLQAALTRSLSPAPPCADAKRRDEYLQRLMGPPNATWQQIIEQAKQSVEVLKQAEVIRNVQNILQVGACRGVCVLVVRCWMHKFACPAYQPEAADSRVHDAFYRRALQCAS